MILLFRVVFIRPFSLPKPFFIIVPLITFSISNEPFANSQQFLTSLFDVELNLTCSQNCLLGHLLRIWYFVMFLGKFLYVQCCSLNLFQEHNRIEFIWQQFEWITHCLNEIEKLYLHFLKVILFLTTFIIPLLQLSTLPLQ